MFFLQSLAALALLYVLYRLKKRNSQLPLPPGPPRYPLIGNVFNIPRSFEWRTYHQWSRDIGSDILYLNLMGQSLIILDSFEAATDLMDKRSLVYSSRPQSPFIKLIGATYNFALKKYGENWRQHRRLAHSFFGAPSSENYKPQIKRATLNLMGRLLDGHKVVIRNEIRDMVGDILLSTCYGLDVTTEEGAYYFTKVHDGTAALVDALQPGRFLVDLFPFMMHIPKWLPGAGFRKIAKDYHQTLSDMITLPFTASKENMDKAQCPPCFVCVMSDSEDRAAHLGKEDLDATEDDTVRDVSGSMYVAGSDTTMSALASCILGFLSRPDVIHRARIELDAVLELDRLPEFTDEPSLPFITAIAKEALRWQTPSPLGVPHMIESEDEYKGFRIPAGTVVMANSWAMLHDDEIYPDPFTFKPERFMKGDQYDKDAPDPEDACWGFGRRICPGRHMAFASIWLTIASLVYAFDVEKEVDADGHIVEPNPTYVSGLVSYPNPFPCCIKPRSPEHAKLVREGMGKDLELL